MMRNIYRINVLKVLLKNLYFCVFSQIDLFGWGLAFVWDDVKSPRFNNLEEFDSRKGKDLLNIAEYNLMNFLYAALGHTMLVYGAKHQR